MPVWLTALLTLAAVLAIFATMPAGQRVLARLGLRRFAKSAASDEDVEFLLRVCEGDRRAVERRLEAAKSPGRTFSEAELYRRAIRSWFQEKEARESGSGASSD